jgi:hypothetical protein
MGDGMFRHFRPISRGKLIANVGMTAERGNRLIAEGLADLVAFGRPCIANPDLVERLAIGAPLAEVNKAILNLPFAAAGQRLVRDVELSGFFVVVGKRTKTFMIQGDLRGNSKRPGRYRPDDKLIAFLQSL